MADTESFHSSVIFNPTSDETGKSSLYAEIAKHFLDIARQIGDEYGNIVSGLISKQLLFVLNLGKLGSYHIDISNENLATVCNRLRKISSSGKFIRLMNEW